MRIAPVPHTGHAHSSCHSSFMSNAATHHAPTRMTPPPSRSPSAKQQAPAFSTRMAPPLPRSPSTLQPPPTPSKRISPAPTLRAHPSCPRALHARCSYQPHSPCAMRLPTALPCTLLLPPTPTKRLAATLRVLHTHGSRPPVLSTCLAAAPCAHHAHYPPPPPPRAPGALRLRSARSLHVGAAPLTLHMRRNCRPHSPRAVQPPATDFVRIATARHAPHARCILHTSSGIHCGGNWPIFNSRWKCDPTPDSWIGSIDASLHNCGQNQGREIGQGRWFPPPLGTFFTCRYASNNMANAHLIAGIRGKGSWNTFLHTFTRVHKAPVAANTLN